MRLCRGIVAFGLLWAGVPGIVAAAASSPIGVDLISHIQAGDTIGRESQGLFLSGDGRFVVFHSEASDVAEGVVDNNVSGDAFFYDRMLDDTLLLSRSARDSLRTANASTGAVAMDAQARYILLWSDATDLVDNLDDSNRTSDVFLFDRTSGHMTLLSHAHGDPARTADAGSWPVAISDDGRWVLINSDAGDFLADPMQGWSSRTYLHDVVTGQRILVSRGTGASTLSSGTGNGMGMSADGRKVVFYSSAPDVVPGQVGSGEHYQVFVFDRDSGVARLVSGAQGSSTRGANDSSIVHTISADGSALLFTSDATDLLAGVTDTNAASDVFVFDVVSDEVQLASHALGSGTATANARSYGHSLSADGAYVLFETAATNILPGLSDGNGSNTDVYLYSRDIGQNRLVSRAYSSDSATGTGFSMPVALSEDGRYVMLSSTSTNLITMWNSWEMGINAYLLDTHSGAMRLLSPRSDSSGSTLYGQGSSRGRSLSSDGRVALVDAGQGGLIEGLLDFNDASDSFVVETDTLQTSLVSRSRGGGLATDRNGHAYPAAISDDARFVLFHGDGKSYQSSVDDRNQALDVFVHDRRTGTSELISHATGTQSRAPQGASVSFDLSDDGNVVLFASDATDVRPVTHDMNGRRQDVFLFARDTATSTLVSRGGYPQMSANDESTPVALCGNGAMAVFQSVATNLLAIDDANGSGADVFVFDRASEALALVSTRAGDADVTANGESIAKAVTPDCSHLLIQTRATDLAADVQDQNGDSDVYLHDRAAGTVRLVSRTRDGAANVAANGASFAADVDAGGRRVVFWSRATDLVPGTQDRNGTGTDVYLFDAVGATTLVSRARDQPNATANGTSVAVALSPDGNRIVFHSDADDLVSGVVDSNGAPDVFVHDIPSGRTMLLSTKSGDAQTAANGASYPVAISTDGQQVLFHTTATDLLSGTYDRNREATDAYIHDLRTGTNTLLSRRHDDALATVDVASMPVAISGDGRAVLFGSRAAGLVADVADYNSFYLSNDVFVASIGALFSDHFEAEPASRKPGSE